MKSIYLLSLLPFLTFCSSPNTKNLEANTPKVGSLKESPKYHYVQYDWDKNGTEDTFEFVNDNEDVIINFNGTSHKFSTTSTFYDKFAEPSVLKYNQIKDSTFIFLRINPKTEALLLKDKGDFSGPVLNLWTYEPDNKIKKIWEGTGEFTEVADLDKNGSLEFVMEDIQSEPGYTVEYVFVSFTLFKVYTFRNNQLIIDPQLSHNYNIRHKPFYEKTIGMKTPVLARSRKSNAIDFNLVLDLNEINKQRIPTK
jgi:hypothetical protein